MIDNDELRKPHITRGLPKDLGYEEWKKKKEARDRKIDLIARAVGSLIVATAFAMVFLIIWGLIKMWGQVWVV